MTAALAHRGPDADGFHFDGPVGLRPSPAEGDRPRRQPPAAPLRRRRDRRRVQRRDLQLSRVAPRARGAPATCSRTQGDGEVLVHGWRQWGRALLDRIAGMFAFALWDRERRELFLARDHLGVKPLYYAWHAGALVFGSELKALLPFPGLPRDARSRRARALSRMPVHPGAAQHLRRGAQAAGGALARGARRQARRPARSGGRRTCRSTRSSDAARPTRSTRELRALGANRCWSPTCRSARSSAAASIRGSSPRSPREASGRAARHVQSRLHRPRRRQRARRGGARRAAHRQPPPLPDAGARRRAARARALGRRVRRAVRRPGRAADDAARRIRARDGDRRADRRRRRRSVRRLRQLREAPARGADHRACSARAARRCRGCSAACRRASRATASSRPPAEPRARRYATIPNIFDALLRARVFHRRVPRAAARRASPIAPRRSTTSAIRRRTSTTCSTSTRGCGCPTTCSPRSTARRWRFRSKRACRISTTTSTAGARGSTRRIRSAATRASCC